MSCRERPLQLLLQAQWRGVFGSLTLKSDQHLQIKVGAPTTKAICFWSRERHRSELMQQWSLFQKRFENESVSDKNSGVHAILHLSSSASGIRMSVCWVCMQRYAAVGNAIVVHTHSGWWCGGVIVSCISVCECVRNKGRIHTQLVGASNVCVFV